MIGSQYILFVAVSKARSVFVSVIFMNSDETRRPATFQQNVFFFLKEIFFNIGIKFVLVLFFPDLFKLMTKY